MSKNLARQTTTPRRTRSGKARMTPSGVNKARPATAAQMIPALGITVARAWALACYTHANSQENRSTLAGAGAILLHREFDFEVWLRGPDDGDEPGSVVAVMATKEGDAVHGIGSLDDGVFVDNLMFSEREYAEHAERGLRGSVA